MCFLATAPISLIGSIVPISLFAVITEMMAVSGRIAASTSFGSTSPYLSTGRYVTSMPIFSRYSQVLMIAWCSMLETMTCFPLAWGPMTADFIAQLSDSDPPDVK